VRAFLERWGSRTAFVNGIAVGSISHSKCTQLMLTGSRKSDAADLPTILASATAADRVLPHLVLSGPRFPGELGGAMVPLSPTLTRTMTGAAPESATYHPAVEAFIQDQVAAASEGLAAGSDDPAYAAFETALDRLGRLQEAAPDLDIRAGASDGELLERGVAALAMGMSRCLIIQGSMPGYSSWDSHQDNEGQQTRSYDHTFGQLGELLDLLSSTSTAEGSMLDCTTVLVMSEMGRTPFLNAGMGKDHWPYTSAMLLGAGVRGDRVVGVSDDVLVGQSVDHATGEAASSGELLGAAGLLAGVLTSFGVDPGAYFPGVTPFTAPFL